MQTQYLATAGQTNFFLPDQASTMAILQAWQLRIWMNPIATHAFAATFLFIAFASLALHIRHAYERKRLFLAGPVGSIASAVSLTSSARFAGLLNAGDTEKALKEKLDGMYFGIDKETWQIIVERDTQHYLDTAFYPDDVKGELDLGKGKRRQTNSTASMTSASTGTVVGTKQHPTAVAIEETIGKRYSTINTPVMGTFSAQQLASSPYDRKMSGVYSPPGRSPSLHSASLLVYQDPYTRWS
jgi:hypothetical protein